MYYSYDNIYYFVYPSHCVSIEKMNSMHYISGNKISSAITKTAFTTTELYCITQVEMEIYELED